MCTVDEVPAYGSTHDKLHRFYSGKSIFYHFTRAVHSSVTSAHDLERREKIYCLSSVLLEEIFPTLGNNKLWCLAWIPAGCELTRLDPQESDTMKP